MKKVEGGLKWLNMVERLKWLVNMRSKKY